jgi:RHS repeat-associated protein
MYQKVPRSLFPLRLSRNIITTRRGAGIYDGENQIAKYDDLGNLLVSYFQEPSIDNPISMRRAAAGGDLTYYYHADSLGSVSELTDANGEVAQSYRYDAFGSIVQGSGNVQNPFTYTGREFDPETGLYYYRARYYDAKTGRFESRDPLFQFIGSYRPGALRFYDELRNNYLYVANNPILLADPTGLLGEGYTDCVMDCWSKMVPHCVKVACSVSAMACIGFAPGPQNPFCWGSAACAGWIGGTFIGCSAFCGPELGR